MYIKGINSSGGGGSATASGTSFDNTTAQLPNDPKDVQSAIEEVANPKLELYEQHITAGGTLSVYRYGKNWVNVSGECYVAGTPANVTVTIPLPKKLPKPVIPISAPITNGSCFGDSYIDANGNMTYRCSNAGDNPRINVWYLTEE